MKLIITSTFIMLVITYVAQAQSTQSAEWHYINGTIQAKVGEIDKAIAEFNEAIEVKPDYAEAFYERGVALFIKGDHQSALADFSKHIELKPNHAQSFYYRGQIYTAFDLDKAFSDFNTCIALGLPTYDGRGSVKRLKGDIDGAISDFQTSISLNPGNVIPYMNLGLVWMERGLYEQSLEFFNMAVEKGPHEPWAYINRASLLEAMGDVDGAALDLQKATQQHPSLTFTVGRGIVDPAKGKNNINALTVVPMTTEIVTMINRGNLYRKKGEFDAAIAEYKKVIKFNPKNFVAYVNRGLALQEKGKLKAAVADFSRALEISKGLAYIYGHRGIANLLQRKDREAQKDFEENLRFYPTAKAELEKRIEKAKQQRERDR